MRFAMRPEPTMIQRLAERLYLLIARRDIDLLEITYGVLLIGWGVQLLMPWDTFRTGVGYTVLAQLMPESAWGLVLAWIGFTQVGAYMLDHWRVRLIATLFAVMVWTFLSVAFGVANPYGTGVIVYPTLAFTSAIVFWRLVTRRVERP